LLKAAILEDKNVKPLLKSSDVSFANSVAEMPEKLSEILRDGDVLISMGAGSISSLPHTLAEVKNA